MNTNRLKPPSQSGTTFSHLARTLQKRYDQSAIKPILPNYSMPTLLFSLRNVPDDEADKIRALLGQHAIPFYETPPGNWGISMPAIWLTQSEFLPEALALLNSYQQQRAIQQRELYRQQQASGNAPSFFGRISRNPLQCFVYFLAAGLVLYISIRWVIALNLPKTL